MNFKHIKILKKLMGKTGDFQSFFKELIELEQKQAQIKKQLSMFNRPSKIKKKEDGLSPINFVLENNGLSKLRNNEIKEQLDLLVDKFIENDQYYDQNRDRILAAFNSIVNEIKTSFFMTEETRELLQYKFNKISEEYTKMRDICLFNMAVFSAFIYFYESKEVMISEIKNYLDKTDLTYKLVPSYENTYKYEYEYEKFGFFFTQK